MHELVVAMALSYLLWKVHLKKEEQIDQEKLKKRYRK